MNTAETAFPFDSGTSTRIVHPGRQKIILAVWIFVVLLDIGIFAAGLPDYARGLRSGCLCDSAFIDMRNGAVIVEPFPDGQLANLAQDGDVIVAVDGKPLPANATTQQAVALTDAGEAGTSVTLKLRTGDAPPRDVPIKRSVSNATADIGLKLGMSLDSAIIFPLLIEIIVFICLVGVALFVASKRSDDWMALVASVMLLTYGLIGGDAFGYLSYYHASLVWDLFQAGGQGISFATLIIFPDGRFRPRWSLLITILWTLWEFLKQTRLIVTNDFVGGVVSLIFIIVALSIVAYRYRYYFSPLRRQQTKWLFFGVGAALLINQLFFLIIDLISQQPGYQFYLLYRTLLGLGYPPIRLTLLLIPLGFAFAVLSYRLWDIDLTVNRSLVFGIVTVILGALFLMALFIVDQLLSRILGPGQWLAALVISASVTALCFNPVRKRVRTFIDRRIYRFRFDLNELQQAQKPIKIANPGILTGKTIGNYEILGVLGKGGMGEVYQGQDGTRLAAIKILPSSLASQPTFVKRFEREALTLASFHHPNIVKIYDAGLSDGIYYMAMEFIDGQELSDLIEQRGAIPIEEVRPLLSDFAVALDYAHRNGLVHRDIKPSNIMLRQIANQARTQAVLMDFGLAKIADASTSLTGANAVGTIGYMAPEQIMAVGSVDRRADIYALGIVLYEMLTGELPFKGSPAQMLFAHLQQPPPDAHEFKSDIPEAVARAITKALSKMPEDRFETVGEFAEALV